MSWQRLSAARRYTLANNIWLLKDTPGYDFDVEEPRVKDAPTSVSLLSTKVSKLKQLL